jgi:hypothetical protein
MFDSPIPSIVLLVATFFAAMYGFFAATQLARETRSRDVRRFADTSRGASSGDVPTYVSQGEAFEEDWQGSRGYDRPDARAGQNWVDTLLVSVVTPLRPSRFQDRSYWSSYLPAVAFIRLMVFVGLPILAVILVAPAPSGATTFRPTTVQRNALHGGSPLSAPSRCPNSAVQEPNGRSQPASGPSRPVTTVSANNDGRVYTVHPGDSVVVSSYPRYAPSFSRGSPLCSASPSNQDVTATSATETAPSHQDDFVATTTGTGVVYFPEPGGSAFVAKIDVVALRSVPVVLLVIAGVVFFLDVVFASRLRRSRR